MDSTEFRLNELLAYKDKALNEANEEISNLQRQLRFGTDWMLHGRESDPDTSLPAPRLELNLVHNTEYHSEQVVVLVLPERDGSHSHVPLSYSKTSGSGVRLDQCPTKGELHTVLLPSLINDLCFYSEKMSLPAFVMLDEEHRYKVESLRPLKVVAL